MEQMPKIESVPDKEKISRRDFLKKAGKVMLAVGVTETVGKFIPSESEAGEKEFDNKEYLDLEQEFIKKGFSDSRVFREFRARYGKEAFKEFKKKYNLSDEEANKKWSGSILRHGDTFLDRARNWEKVKKVAEENGIAIDDRSGFEMVNGEVESINGKRILKKTKGAISSGDRKITPIESIKTDTSAY